MKILLFLLNFNGALGFSGGYYAPDVSDLNQWLTQQHQRRITPTYTLGAEARASFLERFLISLDGNWFNRKLNEGHSMDLKSLDALFGYRVYLLPALLYFYINGGGSFMMVSYKCPNEDSTQAINTEGTIIGPVGKASIKFIPTPRFSIELSGGYRYLKSSDISGLPKGTAIDEEGNPYEFTVPMNVSGVFLKLSLLREFGAITSY